MQRYRKYLQRVQSGRKGLLGGIHNDFNLHTLGTIVDGSSIESKRGLVSVTSTLESDTDNTGRLTFGVVRNLAGRNGADLVRKVIL